MADAGRPTYIPMLPVVELVMDWADPGHSWLNMGP